MLIEPFKLERFFARWEFEVELNLCASDVQALAFSELMAMADEEGRKLWNGLTLGYTESQGHPLLRAEIAALYEGVEPEEVLVFSGAEEAIFLFMHAAIRAGDHLIAAWPGYQSLYSIPESLGAEVERLPLDPSDWRLDLGRLGRIVREDTRAIAVNFPHNPTGALPDLATFQAAYSIAEAAGAYFFSDEVYRFLEHDPAERLPAAVELGSRGVSLGVMSKSFALAGLRIGWIATHDKELRHRLASLKDYTTICASAPSEVLAIIALRAREAVLERSRHIVAENLRLADALFDRCSDLFSWTRPKAGSVGFPRLLSRERIDSFAERLVQKEGVLLLPGAMFTYPGNHFRLGLGRTDFPEGIERLERFARGR